LIFCGIFGVKHGKIWTENTAFGPGIRTGFSGWCPGTRKISEKKPQKVLDFWVVIWYNFSEAVEDGLNRKQKGKEQV